MNKLLGFFLLAVCAVSITAISCRSVADRLTPCDLPKSTASYVGIDPNPEVVSLYDAKEIKQDVTVKHRETQKEMLRKAQDDKDYYHDAIGFITAAIDEAMALQDAVIGDENNPGLIGYLAGISGLGGGILMGRNFLRRPGDYTKDEHEAEVAKAKEAAKKEVQV